MTFFRRGVQSQFSNQIEHDSRTDSKQKFLCSGIIGMGFGPDLDIWKGVRQRTSNLAIVSGAGLAGLFALK